MEPFDFQRFTGKTAWICGKALKDNVVPESSTSGETMSGALHHARGMPQWSKQVPTGPEWLCGILMHPAQGGDPD